MLYAKHCSLSILTAHHCQLANQWSAYAAYQARNRHVVNTLFKVTDDSMIMLKQCPQAAHRVYVRGAGAAAPQRFLLIADWGLSQNSSVTLQHILQSAFNTTTAPVVLYIADFCYAGEHSLYCPLQTCKQ